MNKIVDFEKPESKAGRIICLCVACKHRWPTKMLFSEKPPPCPECKSGKTVIDQLYEAPPGHLVFACACGNKLYKLCKDPDGRVYGLCIACGTEGE